MVYLFNNRAPNTRYYDGSGLYDIDMAVDVYLLSSFGGALTARLPPADAAETAGRVVTIKKMDVCAFLWLLLKMADRDPIKATKNLTAQYRSITVVSDGGSGSSFQDIRKSI